MYWHINLEHDYIDSALGCLSLKIWIFALKIRLKKMGDDTVRSHYSVTDY